MEINPDAIRKYILDVELKVGGETLFKTPALA